MPPDTVFTKIAAVHATKLDDTAAILERQLQAEKESRKEERFFWIFAIALVMDVVLFNGIEKWQAILAIFLLEIVFLIGLAGWLGVDHVAVWLARLFHNFSPRPDKRSGREER
ncbi:MAG: hypothetical protein M0006_13160 [Magnetospirillum sp.]|nr:hypothetical protein [Magnetospirillum sp.]